MLRVWYDQRVSLFKIVIHTHAHYQRYRRRNKLQINYGSDGMLYCYMANAMFVDLIVLVGAF